MRPLQIAILFFLSCISSCVLQHSINFHPHAFNSTPRKIIWIQVAGLSEEHLALLKFFRTNVDEKMVLEKMPCFGKTWSFNLFDLRPKSELGFMSQVTGKKNMVGTCQDYTQRPLWSYASLSGYKTALFERRLQNGGIGESGCNEESEYLRNMVVWKMQKTTNKKAKFFHPQLRPDWDVGEIYYDQACQKDVCQSNLGQNVLFLFEKFTQLKSNYLFIVRDYSYLEYLKSRNLKKARDVLHEIEFLTKYFYQLVEHSANEDILFVVSSTSSMPIDFPEQGENWSKLSEEHIASYKNTSLLSPVWAMGAKAENFCGLYEESELFERAELPSKRLKQFY